MGTKNSLLMPCCDYSLPSSRGGIEDYGMSSTGPIKAFRKKCSIATSETISINPIPVASNRSSVTEFVVNRSESLTENSVKTPDKGLYYSVPNSPGRYRPSQVYRREGKNNGRNIVKEVRSRSLVSSPQQTTSPDMNFGKEMASFKLNWNGVVQEKRRMKSVKFDSLQIEKIIRKKLYS